MRALALASLVVLAGCGGTTVQTRTVVKSDFDAQGIYARESHGVVTVLAASKKRLDSLGSGFVINRAGDIVTNAHVVTLGKTFKRARRVYAKFSDGNMVPARLLGVDLNSDIALLRVKPAGLKLSPLPLGSSRSVKVGAPVAAIGSPFGEERSLSVGVVSATDRNISSLTRYPISNAIQTDAGLNPGNSGGPLVDAAGRVIGVSVQIDSNTGTGVGVGFALPIDLVQRTVGQLRAEGKVRYPYLGIFTSELYPQLARRIGVPVHRGALVTRVEELSPADTAGIHAGKQHIVFQGERLRVGGDVVTRIGDDPVLEPPDVVDALLHHKPGDSVDVEVFRGSERRVLSVTLGERPHAR
jgi:S1-C subfamily serine protease